MSPRTALDAWAELPTPAWYQREQLVFNGGHDLTLFTSGEAYFSALQRAIAEAQREIWFETYIFHDDDTARGIAEALKQAAQRGVQVQLLIDGFGSAETLPVLDEWFAASPVQWRIFQPLTHWWHWLTRNKLRRLHRKLVVIDDELAFVGGINILDDYHDPNHGVLTHPRFDFAVQVRGPLVKITQQAMQHLWWRMQWLSWSGDRSEMLQRLLARWRDIPTVRHRRPVRAALALRDNLRQRRTIEKAYLRAIAHAHDEIILANAYFFPGTRFRRALRAAAQRGVRVTLLLQGRVEYPLQHYATQAMYDELLTAGVRIVEYHKSFLHAKVGVIDGEWSTVGSSNIDPFSLLLAYEANIVVLDVDFSAQLHGVLSEAIAQSTDVTPSRHAQRSWLVRLFNRLAMALLRLGVSISGEARRY